MLDKLNSKLTIETDELEQLIKEGTPDVSLLNATIKRRDYNPKVDHVEGGRIPGAVYLDF